MCHYSITGLVGTHSNQKKVTQKFHVSTPLTGTSASITEAHNLYQQHSSQGGNASNGIFFFFVPSFQGQDESNHKLMGSTHFSTPESLLPQHLDDNFYFQFDHFSILRVIMKWTSRRQGGSCTTTKTEQIFGLPYKPRHKKNPVFAAFSKLHGMLKSAK